MYWEGYDLLEIPILMLLHKCLVVRLLSSAVEAVPYCLNNNWLILHLLLLRCKGSSFPVFSPILIFCYFDNGKTKWYEVMSRFCLIFIFLTIKAIEHLQMPKGHRKTLATISPVDCFFCYIETWCLVMSPMSATALLCKLSH